MKKSSIRAKLWIAVGTKLFNKVSSSVKWENESYGDWFTPYICKYAKGFYYQFSTEKIDGETVRQEPKYFRFSLSGLKLFYINIGATSYRKSTGSGTYKIHYDRFWFDVKFRPFMKLIKSIKETKYGRTLNRLIELHKDYKNWSRAYQILTCSHANMKFEASITGNSGSEYFECPDCGYSGTIQYY